MMKANELVTPWLTVPEAAAHSRSGPKVIYRAIKAKQLKAIKVGSRFLVSIEWLDEWQKANVITHEPTIRFKAR